MSSDDQGFIIRNRENHRVLDDKDMSTRPGNPIIDYPYKPQGNSNQRWRYDAGRLYNKHSGLILTFKNIRPESTATQEEFDARGEGQKFKFDDGIMSLVDHDDLVVGAWDQDVKIVTRNPGDPARRWDFSD